MNRWIQIGRPVAALMALTGCGDNPETLFASARADYAAQNYQQARVTLVSALRKQPANPEMLGLLAKTYLRLRDTDGAQTAVEQFDKARGDRAALARMKAELALLQQNPAAALALLQADPSSDAWRIKAEAYLALGDDRAARQAFEQGMAARGQTDDDMRLATSYGRFLLMNEDYALAATVSNRLQTIAPHSYEALVMAGDLATAQGRENVAENAYLKAIKSFPEQAAPMIALAHQYEAAGKIVEASEMVERAARITPDDPRVDELRFLLLSEKGDWEKIRLALQTRESSLKPGSALSMTYGEALLRLGHAEQARAIFRRTVLVQPHNAYARAMLGEAQLKSGDAQGAWETLKPLAASPLAQGDSLELAAQAANAVGAPEGEELRERLRPARLKADMAMIERGEAALARQDWKLAASVYQHLLQRAEDPEVLKRLAVAQSRLGKHDAAVRQADRALRFDRDNADYLYVAGMVRSAAGQDLWEARRLLEAAAAISPENNEIARELDKVKAATS